MASKMLPIRLDDDLRETINYYAKLKGLTPTSYIKLAIAEQLEKDRISSRV